MEYVNKVLLNSKSKCEEEMSKLHDDIITAEAKVFELKEKLSNYEDRCQQILTALSKLEGEA